MDGTKETPGMALPVCGEEIELLDLSCDDTVFTAQEICMFGEQAVLVPDDLFDESVQQRIIKAVILGLAQEFAEEFLVGRLF